MIGKSLLHYEIISQIGRGGMGEVYQAKDTKLGRDVAIKVLPEEFAMDHDRVTRFQREAKLLASLNHPNIAAIHGLEEFEGTHFLVMELIEGDTLRDRIKSGSIPIEEALKLALQMAEALEAAHEKGVIHRDLKPANIKVTPDGKVKILDFGLAKAYSGDSDKMDPADSPTISAAATQKGVILGTAAYMSPEQARGKFVDMRADIWAFGAVLYEMLTGEKAFAGGDTTDTLAAVLRSEPEWDSLPANLHWRVKEVLERCLEKKARDRYSGISDTRVEIQKTLADPSGLFTRPISIQEPRTQSRQMLLWASITVILVIAAGIVTWNLRTPEKPAIIRLDHDLPKEQQFGLTQRGNLSIAVSPNGRQFVYGTTEGLYMRSVDELDARLITGTDEYSNSPFFSPDGKWIVYRSENDRKLKKISINGGAPSILCDIPTLGYAGGRWYADNTLIFTLVPEGVMKIPSSGGTPEPLTKKTDLAEVIEMGGIPAAPQMLPDGKTLLYTKTHLVSGQTQIEIQSIESEETKPLLSGFNAQYLPTGHLLYALNENNVNNLFAVPFDLDKLEVTGGSISILEGVSAFAVSDSGTLVYIPQPANTGESGGVIEERRTLVLVDRDGNEEPLDTPPNVYKYPKFSPDGTQLAINVQSGRSDVWIWDFARKTLTPLTFEGMGHVNPRWTPDGAKIAFLSVGREDGGPYGGIYWKASDGTGEAELLFSLQEGLFVPYSFSSDGKFLAFTKIIDTENQDLGILVMEGDRESKMLLQKDYMEIQPQISPDERFIAYTSNESGQMEVYVRPFPDVNQGRWRVSTNGGDSPLWSPDGSELFYLVGNTEAVMAVAVETEPTFKFENPETLFRGKYVGAEPSDGTPYDVHPKEKRFLMIKPPMPTGEGSSDKLELTGPRKINIVLNWDEELKQRVPVD